jgi:pSer/pThr/pTyr-binding forkhead associated (FHA) protein
MKSRCAVKLFLQNPDVNGVVPAVEIEQFPFVIGRKRDCDWSLPLAFISRRHCRFTREGNQVQVQDLESHNGTFVNGKRASSPLPVHHGDEVSLGPVAMRVVMPAQMLETKEDNHILTKEEAPLRDGVSS